MDDRTRIITTFDNLSQVINAALFALAEHRGFELEDEDFRIAGIAAGENIVYQLNAQAFADSVAADLEALPTQDGVTQEGVPNHRPEFGL